MLLLRLAEAFLDAAFCSVAQVVFGGMAGFEGLVGYFGGAAVVVSGGDGHGSTGFEAERDGGSQFRGVNCCFVL